MVRDKRYPELFLIPAAQTRDKTAIKVEDMQRVAHKAAEVADYVLIDSPAGIEHGFQYAVAPADQVLIITNPEVAAVRDADRVIGLIEAQDRGIASNLIINRMQVDMVRRNEMLDSDTVVDLLAIDLIGVVPEDNQILAASNRGQPVILSQKTLASKAFYNIARRLRGEDVPFEPLKEPGLLQRIFGAR
jgi:septum site-determining protein MinD